MLPSFTYVRPRSLQEALTHLASPGARPHAGGTDLIGCLRDGVFSATTLVSLTDLAELKGITDRPDGGLRIGALTTLTEIANHPKVGGRYAALAQGASAAASPQLRNQGTIGGNLCQRPRCWYYRGDFHCARKGGDTCYAIEGENEFHAILGGSGCYFVHPSDTASPLVALEARARISGPHGERTIGLSSFFVDPRQDLTRENVLDRGEVITEILLPSPPTGLRSSYRKVRARGSWDFALAGVALAVQVSNGKVTRGRIVLSGVAPVPWPAREAEEALIGQRLDATTARKAAAVAANGAEPMEHNAYKVDLVRGVVEEALLALV